MNQAAPKYPSTPPGVERVSLQLQSSVLPILPAFPSVHSSTQPGLPGPVSRPEPQPRPQQQPQPSLGTSWAVLGIHVERL
jgi:hypothetical protein